MRKTTSYARKHRRGDGMFNGAEMFNTIARSQGYTDEPVIGGMVKEGTQGAATRAMIMVRCAFEAIQNGRGTEEDFDKLAHALGVTLLRAIAIAGEDEFANPMLPIVRAGTDALRRAKDRYERIHRWGFDGPAIDEVLAAIELYETILQASSPAQMSEATAQRVAILEAMK